MICLRPGFGLTEAVLGRESLRFASHLQEPAWLNRNGHTARDELDHLSLGCSGRKASGRASSDLVAMN
jgi:hypothetical protein